MGIVLKSPEGTLLVQLGFYASNNQSEYEALIMGLKKAKLVGIKDLIIQCDSLLVTNQLTREYASRSQKMEAYMRLGQKLFSDLILHSLKDFFGQVTIMSTLWPLWPRPWNQR